MFTDTIVSFLQLPTTVGTGTCCTGLQPGSPWYAVDSTAEVCVSTLCHVCTMTKKPIDAGPIHITGQCMAAFVADNSATGSLRLPWYSPDTART
jgi:hypothetical protein